MKSIAESTPFTTKVRATFALARTERDARKSFPMGSAHFAGRFAETPRLGPADHG